MFHGNGTSYISWCHFYWKFIKYGRVVKFIFMFLYLHSISYFQS